MLAAAQAGDDPATGRMMITGRVLDPSGKPVPDAAVMVLVGLKYSDRPVLFIPSGRMAEYDGRCDGSGRFRIGLPRTSSAQHTGVLVSATATGYGMGWAELDPDADPPVADVALRPEVVIRGRLFDVKGQPARGVAVRLLGFNTGTPTRLLDQIQHPDVFQASPRDLPAWPAPAISDAEGRFTLRGAGLGLQAVIRAEDPRFDGSMITLRPGDGPGPGPAFSRLVATIPIGPGPEPKPIAIALQPARTIVGRVTYADTGRPVLHAPIQFAAMNFRADAEGRFRASGTLLRRARATIEAQAPEGAPYLAASKPVAWPNEAAVEQTFDLALARGVVVRGKVTEESTGRPIAGAVVRVVPTTGARNVAQDLAVPGATGPDGTYRVAAPPGRGYLVVQGPDDDYVLRVFGGSGSVLGSAPRVEPGHDRFYAHAYRAVDLKPGGPDQEVDLALRRGASVRGRVIGPDGRPVRDARLLSRVVLAGAATGGWKVWLGARDQGRVIGGRFALHGLDVDAEVPAYFFEPGSQLGATTLFSGKSAAAGPITVRLEPCGSARMRLVGPDGQPLPRYPAGNLLMIVVTPGPTYRRNPAKDDPLSADESPWLQIGRERLAPAFTSDAEGRATFPALIPGASYRIVDRTPLSGEGDPVIRKEFTVKPGESLDLGDILVARPRGRN